LELEPLPSRSGGFLLEWGNPEGGLFIQWKSVKL
jgi:hypothetical protein